ncbi:MAG: hypothetical protein KIH69_012820 [Anaerolineae bacterium]|nr:hypothetical protein [Anaerolineae bacterium]
MLRIEFDELDYEIINKRALHIFNGQPFTGIAFEQANGRLVCETTFFEGLEHGVRRSYYDSGKIEIEDYCKLGALHGKFSYFYPSGELKENGVYEYGIMLAKQCWSEDKKLISEEFSSNNEPLHDYLVKLRNRFDAVIDKPFVERIQILGNLKH